MRAYDPAYAYETAVIILDGMKRMYEDGEDAIYYITLAQRKLRNARRCPPACEEGIIRGIYKVSTKDVGDKRPHVQLFGSGAILREALRAKQILAEKYDISSNVWSVTSYKRAAPRRAGSSTAGTCCTRPRRRDAVYVEQVLAGDAGSVHRHVATTCAPWPSRSTHWVPGGLFALGTDGFGRSEDRAHLRRHFEVDAEASPWPRSINWPSAARSTNRWWPKRSRDLGIDPEKIDPWTA